MNKKKPITTIKVLKLILKNNTQRDVIKTVLITTFFCFNFFN